MTNPRRGPGGPTPRALDGPRKVNHGLQVTVFTLLFGVALPLMALQELFTHGWESQLVIVAAAAIAAPPAWMVMREARFRIVVDAGGIEARSLFGERRHLPWAAIERVRYGSITRTLIFQGPGGADGVTLRVSLLRKGIESLGRAIPRYLPEAVYQEAWAEMFGGAPKG